MHSQISTLRSAIPGSAEEASAIPRQSGVLILSIGLLCALLAGSVKAGPVLRLGAGALLTVLMVGLGLFLSIAARRY